MISNKDLIYKRLKNEWARRGKGLSFQNGKVPNGKRTLIEQEQEPVCCSSSDGRFLFSFLPF